jgi:fibronectin type 3 domain-containing protein
MKAHPNHDFECCDECKSSSPAAAAVTHHDNLIQDNDDNYLSSDETIIGDDAGENDEVERFEVDLSQRTIG